MMTVVGRWIFKGNAELLLFSTFLLSSSPTEVGDG